MLIYRSQLVIFYSADEGETDRTDQIERIVLGSGEIRDARQELVELG